jgi:hypothetical protein
MFIRLQEGSYYQTFAGFIFILLCWQWMNSWTSGDSAGNALGWFWLYGLFYALRTQIRVLRQQDSLQSSVE